MCRRMRCLSFIYAARLPAGWSSLPPGNGRAALDCRYIWHCNTWDVRPPVSPSEPVGSYPTFSPLPYGRRLFSVTYPRRRRRLPVRKHVALCCPDFPLGVKTPSDRPHFCLCRGIRHKPAAQFHFSFCKRYDQLGGV